MFIDFFYKLKSAELPVSVQEYLGLLEALDKGLMNYSVEEFYFLSRALLVKHESNLDKFDRLFGEHFKGLENIPDETFLKDIPLEWLKKEMERHMTKEEMEAIEKLGGPEALMERFKELLKEQRERHEGGDTWIGTGGTSPYGAYGYNPEGYRIGQAGSRHRRAIKVWDKRDFANLDDSVELNTRNMKLALKRLRQLTREGIPDELDIDDTIKKTSRNAGMLDISMVPSKQNKVKVLMLFDIGGSMDDHVATCSQLFSAAKYEFKHMEFYYFHNCLYEYVWKDNRRRHSERISSYDLLNKYNKDYKVIFVGDAAMSPVEIMYQGGSVEHFNDEPGIVWLERFKAQYPHMAWINPNAAHGWDYFQSTRILREFMDYRMFPMTLGGITKCMRALKDRRISYGGSAENN